MHNLTYEAIDLARVEVLRGPQGTLYGQGSVGGTVPFLSLMIHHLMEFLGKLDLRSTKTSKGGWSKEVTGIANIPVVDNVMAFRGCSFL